MNIPILTKLREARVDTDTCMVEGIILASGISENGTYYPSEVVEKSAGVFKGVQCYADHLGPGETERSVRDVVGAIEETWAESGSIHAKVRLSRAHDWLLTMISEGLLGDLSINALGKTKVTRRDGRVVREVMEITRAHSVDFVARAAAGGHVERILHESAAYGEGLRLIERISPQELLAARPDVIEVAKAEARAELLSEQGTGTSEIEKLEEEISRRTVALRRESIATRLIDSSRLPAKVRGFLLIEALALKVDSEDGYEAAVAGIIERHRNYLASLSGEGIIRGMGSSKSASGEDSRVAGETRRLMGIA